MVHPADGAHVASGNAADFIAEILASGVQKRFEFGHNFGVLVMAGAETVSDAVVGSTRTGLPIPGVYHSTPSNGIRHRCSGGL